jgi:hypothetical protein
VCTIRHRVQHTNALLRTPVCAPEEHLRAEAAVVVEDCALFRRGAGRADKHSRRFIGRRVVEWVRIAGGEQARKGERRGHGRAKEMCESIACEGVEGSRGRGVRRRVRAIYLRPLMSREERDAVRFRQPRVGTKLVPWQRRSVSSRERRQAWCREEASLVLVACGRQLPFASE